ncbi:MAG: hypothetical protein WAM66_08370 [Acidobacteriaceae bacterium]
MTTEVRSPAQQGTGREGSDAVFARWILLLAGLWCICWFIHARHYWEDDAYIHLEFARNVASGHGYSFNGLLVNGDTSPAWVLLLAGAHALVPNWLIAGKILAALGAIFALAGTYSFGKHLTAGCPGQRSFAAAMVLLLATNPYFCYWSFSGMETLTALGLGLWATLAAVKNTPTWPSFFLGCFLAGVTPVLRPEMTVLSGLLGLMLLWQWLRRPGGGISGRKLAALTLGLVLITAPLILWSAYALHAFGHVIPNTNAAKRAMPGESVVMRLLSVYGLGFPLVLVEIVGVAILAAVRREIFRRDLDARNLFGILPAAWMFVLWLVVATIFYIFDHTWVQTRYIFVMAPGVMFAMLAFNYRRLPRWVYRLSLAGALLAGVAMSLVTTWPLVRNKSIGDEKIAGMAAYVRNDLPSDAPVAIYSIGEVAFDSQHPVIDIGGITRPGVIPYMLSGDSWGVVQWAWGQGARYFVSGVQPGPGAVLVYSVKTPVVGWSLHPRYYSRTETLRIWKLPESLDSLPRGR